MADETELQETKFIYHIDEEEPPFLIKLNIPPPKVTLGDFKTAINKSNYKYFVKSKDDDFGYVKEEITEDDSHLPCFNGRVVVWLVTAESSQTGENNEEEKANAFIKIPDPPKFGSSLTQNFLADNERTETEDNFNDSESNQDKIAPLRNFKSFKTGGRYLHHYGKMHGGGGTYETTSSMLSSDLESTIIYDSEDESRMSFATGTTRSSIYGRHRQKNRRRRHQTMSRASSFSSITDSTMSLNIVTVTLSLDKVAFLGISIVGQSNGGGGGGTGARQSSANQLSTSNAGIYVGSVMRGGAVAADGRIEPGDMLLEVNGISFEAMSNDQAVRALREQVHKPGPITLVVAKCWDTYMPKSSEYGAYFTLPRQEPVRPIDPRAWVLHTNMMTANDNDPSRDDHDAKHNGANNTQNLHHPSNATPNGSALGQNQLKNSPHTTNGSGVFLGQTGATTQHGGVMPGGTIGGGESVTSSLPCVDSQPPMLNGAGGGMPMPPLTAKSDPACILRAMLMPESGLEIRDRVWLKITIPCAVIGSDLVDWLYRCVDGFHHRKQAKKFAAELLKYGFIRHTVNKTTFSEQCYYVFGDLSRHLSRFSLEEVDSVSVVNGGNQMGFPQGGHGMSQSDTAWPSHHHAGGNANSTGLSAHSTPYSVPNGGGGGSSCGQYSSVQSPVYPSSNDATSHTLMESMNSTQPLSNGGVSCALDTPNNDVNGHQTQSSVVMPSRSSMSSTSSSSSNRLGRHKLSASIRPGLPHVAPGASLSSSTSSEASSSCQLNGEAILGKSGGRKSSLDMLGVTRQPAVSSSGITSTGITVPKQMPLLSIPHTNSSSATSKTSAVGRSGSGVQRCVNKGFSAQLDNSPPSSHNGSTGADSMSSSTRSPAPQPPPRITPMNYLSKHHSSGNAGSSSTDTPHTALLPKYRPTS